MSHKRRLIVEQRGSRWVVRFDGSERPESDYGRRDHAILRARQLAKREAVELIVTDQGVIIGREVYSR